MNDSKPLTVLVAIVAVLLLFYSIWHACPEPSRKSQKQKDDALPGEETSNLSIIHGSLFSMIGAKFSISTTVFWTYNPVREARP